MLDSERRRTGTSRKLAFIATLVLAWNCRIPAGVCGPAFLAAQLQTSDAQARARYEVRAFHDPNGTGKFYVGREIAQVMGISGIGWLDRPERTDQEQPDVVIKAMGLRG